jgi:hypothetical protein
VLESEKSEWKGLSKIKDPTLREGYFMMMVNIKDQLLVRETKTVSELTEELAQLGSVAGDE